MTEYVKYPRTFHLPWSKGTSSDDRLMTARDLDVFKGREIVVTEKLDGENTTMYRDKIHARSLDSRSYPDQNWVRQLHGQIQHDIPDGWRVCGENMYAKHSIYYDRLTTFFYVFSIWNEYNVALSWDDTKEYASMLGLQTVPELYRGNWNEDAVKACWPDRSAYGNEQEGYVVRVVEHMDFPTVTKEHEMPVFPELAKFVREKHVRTNQFWRQTWTPNKLKD